MSFYAAKKLDNHQKLMILAIIGYIFTLLSLFLIIQTPSANRYEFSIYEAYKWYFWFFIISAQLSGIIILLYNPILKFKSQLWVVGYFILIITNSILLLLPVFRGYFSNGRHDVLSHIAHMVDIENTSHILDNSYPMIHILGFTIKSICDLNFNYLSMFLPFLFSILYMISWYILAKKLFSNKKMLMLVLTFSSILLLKSYHVLLSPNAETILFIPFVLYLFFRSISSSNQMIFRFLLILVNIYVVFSHPLLTWLLIFTFIILDYSTYITQSIDHQKSDKLIIIMFIIFFSWSTYVYILTQKLNIVIDAIITTTESQSELERYTVSVSSSNFSPLDLIQVYFYNYGQFFVLGLLSIISIYILIMSHRKKKQKMTFIHHFTIVGYLFFALLSLFLLMTIDEFGFMRIYSYSMFFSVILIPLAIYMLVNKKSYIKDQMYLKIIPSVVLVLALIIYASVFSIHYSPLNLKENQQSTLSEYVAINKLSEVKKDYPILECGIVYYRFYVSLNGVAEAKKHHVRYVNTIIDHFGYNHNQSLKDNYNETSYILINDVGRNLSHELYPKHESKWAYTNEDFKKLNDDTEVIKWYSNLNVDIYKIK